MESTEERQEPLTAGFKLEEREWTLIAPLQVIEKEVWPARLKIEKERCEDKVDWRWAEEGAAGSFPLPGSDVPLRH